MTEGLSDNLNRAFRSLGDFLIYYKVPVWIFILFASCLLTITLYPRNSIQLFMDTYNVYAGFHYNYQEFYFNGRLPEWDPYLHYGQPTYVYDLIFYAPLHYVAIVIGKLLHINNSYHMFLCVFCVEMFIYIFGMFVLLKRFLRSNMAIYIAIGSTALTSIPISNMYTNFLGAYLIPISLYFLMEAFEKRKFYYFLIAVFIGMVFGFGITTYWVGIYLFVYTTAFVLLFTLQIIKDYEKRDLAYWRSFFSLDAKNILALIFVVLFGAGLVYLLATSREYLSFSLTSGRDPVTLKNTISTFLNYPEAEGFRNTLEAFLGGASVHPDWSNFYLTSVGMFFLIYALLRARDLIKNVYFIMATIMFFVTLFLCWGPYTPVAKIAYYFPLVAYFRHLAGLFTFPKLFGAIVAGFGVQMYIDSFENGTKREGLWNWNKIAGLAAGLVCLCISIIVTRWYFEKGGNINHDAKVIKSAIALITVNFFSLMLLTAAVTKMRFKTFLTVCMVVLTMQSLLYYWHYRYNYYEAEPIDRSRYTHVHRSPFEETRVELPNHRNVAAWEAIAAQHGAGLASHGWLDIDLCRPFGRVDYSTRGVFNLITAGYEDFPKVVGCGTAKIQLINDYEESFEKKALDNGEHKNMLERGIVLDDGTGKIIMLNREGKGYPDAKTLAEQGVEVAKFTANTMNIKALSSAPEGGWLIYADAYHPYWTAAIDGSPVTIWKADMAFKAVKIPYGTHYISFEFGQPFRRIIYWACVLSGGIGILGAVFWAIMNEKVK